MRCYKVEPSLDLVLDTIQKYIMANAPARTRAYIQHIYDSNPTATSEMDCEQKVKLSMEAVKKAQALGFYNIKGKDSKQKNE